MNGGTQMETERERGGLPLRRAARGSLPRPLLWAFGVAAAVLLAGTGAAYLASSGGTAGSVVTTLGLGGSGGAGGTGAAVSVTPLAVSITTSKGQAQLDAGMETARIGIASGAGGALLVNVGWIDPQDATKVLQSPRSFILAGLYQEDATTTAALGAGGAGSCGTGEYRVDDSAKGWLCLESLSGGSTLGILTRSSADAMLQGSISGLTDVYVLTSIYVSNNVLPGQQGTLPSLQFYVSAQLAG